MNSESFLKFQKLSHEVEVGRNVWFARPDVIIGIVETESALVHEVGDCDCDGARDAGQAVHQHSMSIVPTFIDEPEGLGEEAG